LPSSRWQLLFSHRECQAQAFFFTTKKEKAETFMFLRELNFSITFIIFIFKHVITLCLQAGLTSKKRNKRSL
jgi:hypothetical protein